MPKAKTKTQQAAIARKKRRRALVKSGGSVYRNIGKKRIRGAGGRKLGPKYPSKHVKSADPKKVGQNIRYFYKTKGKPLDQAIAIALNVKERASRPKSGTPRRNKRRKRT